MKKSLVTQQDSAYAMDDYSTTNECILFRNLLKYNTQIDVLSQSLIEI